MKGSSKMSASRPETLPFDYDDDPDRFRINVESVEKYSLHQNKCPNSPVLCRAPVTVCIAIAS